jgi:hypothetical protein
MATNDLTASFDFNALGEQFIVGGEQDAALITIPYIGNFEFSIIADADASYSIGSGVGTSSSGATPVYRTDLTNLTASQTGTAKNVGIFKLNILALGTTTGVVRCEIKFI